MLQDEKSAYAQLTVRIRALHKFAAYSGSGALKAGRPGKEFPVQDVWIFERAFKQGPTSRWRVAGVCAISGSHDLKCNKRCSRPVQTCAFLKMCCPSVRGRSTLPLTTLLLHIETCTHISSEACKLHFPWPGMHHLIEGLHCITVSCRPHNHLCLPCCTGLVISACSVNGISARRSPEPATSASSARVMAKPHDLVESIWAQTHSKRWREAYLEGECC